MIFKDKSVIITGGSEGVGAAAARLFAEAGANLMLVARNRKNLEAIAAELRDKSRVEIFPMDVSDADSCEDLIKKTQFEFGRIDVLVNNAGFQARGYVESVTAEDLGRTIDVNLRAPIMLTRLALPHIREAGGGAIINVASLAGRTPVPGSAAYSASKFGLRAFTFSLAEEIRDSGIKLAVVSPGPISTQFILADIDKTSDLTFSQPISSAEEVAQVILDLCGNNQREQAMPAISGVLTTLSYLMPWLGRALRPALERRGSRVKKELKARAKAKSSETSTLNRMAARKGRRGRPGDHRGAMILLLQQASRRAGPCRLHKHRADSWWSCAHFGRGSPCCACRNNSDVTGAYCSSAKASLVRFSQPSASTRTLSSTRMPP
jgi:short-subunit dehydrogenase